MVQRIIKFYPNNQFNLVKNFALDNQIELVSAIEMNNDFYQIVLKNPGKFMIDISNWVVNLNSYRERIHDMEFLVNKFADYCRYICNKETLPLVMDIFKYEFSSFEILECCNDNIELKENKQQKIKLITELNNTELINFVEHISTNIVGHNKFKDELLIKLKSFRLFNKLGEQKLFSVFLMGESGIGKTEVGRQMHIALHSSTRLCKISFGNYSSKDSLNSLIGSPRGYMGSETGELPLKLAQSDTGIILIDEFEKADNPVFNFFLDLLEEGKFTDSQSNTYDLNGYIIIFTSNLSPEQYYKRISPELRSRFDYVSQFNLLSDEDKKDYMYKRIEKIIENFEKSLNVKISKNDKAFLYSIDYHGLNNLRKINRAIKDKFAEIANNYLD